MNPRTSPALIFTTLCVALTIGCSDPQRAPLVGRWVLEEPGRVANRIDTTNDRQQTIDSTDGSSTDGGTPSPKMSLNLYGNGALETTTRMGNVNRQKKGTWEVISFDEQAQKMTIRCKIGLEETDHPVELIDRATIRLVPPNMAGLSMKMLFIRDE